MVCEAGKILQSALAASTVHGVCHAASSQRISIRVMWSVLFLVFVGLFGYGAVNLMQKLHSKSLAKSFELDKAPFEFPDLYFCPTNPYSGSFPYTLSRDEADSVNKAIDTLIDLCNGIAACRTILDRNRKLKISLLHANLPVKLQIDTVAQRHSQSVFSVTPYETHSLIGASIIPETFSHAWSLLCFRVVLNDTMRDRLRMGSSGLMAHLSTDPYFPDFNYTGHPIQEFKDGDNKTINFYSRLKHTAGQWFKTSGYTMLMVPSGAYPSIEHEHSIQLTPGNAYSVKIHMEDHVIADQLHGSHCAPNNQIVTLRDPYSHEWVKFNPSFASCFQEKFLKLMYYKANCVVDRYPLPLELKHVPRCGNLSEVDAITFTKMVQSYWPDLFKVAELQAVESCTSLIPCRYKTYSSTASFHKWPNLANSLEDFEHIASIGTIDHSAAPALAKLKDLVRQLRHANRSSHLWSVVREYSSESLIGVQISSASMKSPQVTLSYSFTAIDFLAEIGGLLGLYTGCSVLSLFELVELFVSLFGARNRWCSSEQGTAGDPQYPTTTALQETGPADVAIKSHSTS